MICCKFLPFCFVVSLNFSIFVCADEFWEATMISACMNVKPESLTLVLDFHTGLFDK